MDDIPERVRRILTQVLRIDPEAFRPELPLLEYGLDSLKATDLIVSLEEDFQVSISDREAAGLRCADDIVRFLRARSGVR